MNTKSLISLFSLLVLNFCGCIIIKQSYPKPKDQAKINALIDTSLKVDPFKKISAFQNKSIGAISLSKMPGTPMYYFMAKVNNHKVKMLIDWGAGMTVAFTPRTALRCKTKLGRGTYTARSISSEFKAHEGLIDSFAFPNKQIITNVPFLMGDKNIDVFLMKYLKIFEGEALIGAPFLFSFNQFAIDLNKDVIWLGNIPEELLKNEKYTIPFQSDSLSQKATIIVNIDGEDIPLTVDISGSAGSGISLFGQQAKKFMEKNKVKLSGKTTGSGGKYLDEYSCTVHQVRAGNYRQENVVIHLVPEANGNTGIAGNKFFGNSIVGFDVEKKMIILCDSK